MLTASLLGNFEEWNMGRELDTREFWKRIEWGLRYSSVLEHESVLRAEPTACRAL